MPKDKAYEDAMFIFGRQLGHCISECAHRKKSCARFGWLQKAILGQDNVSLARLCSDLVNTYLFATLQLRLPRRFLVIFIFIGCEVF
jgi:hypothetical protein